MMLNFSRFAVAALVLCGSFFNVHAEEAVEPVAESKSDDDRWIIAIQTDNDLYTGQGRDEDYTNGQRANVSFPHHKEPKWLMKAVDWFPAGNFTSKRRYNLTYGQSVFTPRDLRNPNIITDDRPYAAYMYLGAGYADPGYAHTDLFNLNIGVTGDLALGQFGQKIVHSIKGSADPEGWGNQLGNEATAMIQFVRIYSGRDGSRWGGKYWDMTPHGGFSLGTPNTHFNSGMTFRFGNGLLLEAGGLPVLQPQMAVHDIYSSDTKFAVNFVAGFEVRAVLYDMFLDGSLFRDDAHTMDSKRITGQAHAGIVAYMGKWRAGMSYILKAKEYKGQKRRHSYATITLSRLF